MKTLRAKRQFAKRNLAEFQKCYLSATTYERGDMLKWLNSVVEVKPLGIAHDKLGEANREIDGLSQRLEEFHEILDRKNRIIRLLAMGDCTAEELRLSDDAELVEPPQKHA